MYQPAALFRTAPPPALTLRIPAPPIHNMEVPP